MTLQMVRKAFTPHEVKLDAAGAVTVAFAQLNVIDSDGDVTLPGAFPSKEVPMSAYGHSSWDGAMPVGKGAITEENGWAIFTGQFLMDTEQGKNAHATVKAMADLQEWSYGYNPIDFAYEQRDGQSIRILKALDVFEVSPVLRGAGVGTHTRAIKSGAPASDAPMSAQLSWYTEGLPAVLDRFKAHATTRATEGRKLSRADRAALEDLVETLDTQLASARGLLTADDPPKQMADPTTLAILLGTARANGVVV